MYSSPYFEDSDLDLDSTMSLVCVLSDVFTTQIFSNNQTLDSA